FTNRGGEEHLRKLEMRFLESGITVARTADNLVRYHGKMMIVDRREFYVFGFNFTHMDTERSRSFGLVTRNPKLVAESARLFEADTKRQEYVAACGDLVVSPVNARQELARFIKGAKRELLIWDPKVSDREMLGLLDERRKAGVTIRIIGSVAGDRLPSCGLKKMRLHVRAIIRDRELGFIGSQSLRRLELDRRREVGVIFRDGSAIKDLVRVFEEDWADSASKKIEKQVAKPAAAPKKAFKKVARAVAKEIPLKP